MKEVYKYWIYYINPKYVDDITCIIDDSLIYAYTDVKELSDIFEFYHDMSKFAKKKVELDRLEVNLLARDEQRKMLKFRKFTTHDKSGNVKIVDIPVTSDEEKYIDLQVMSSLNNLIYKKSINTFPTNIFTDDFIKLLRRLKIPYIFDYVTSRSNRVSITSDKIIIKENPFINSYIYADEVSIYIDLFRNILNDDI